MSVFESPRYQDARDRIKGNPVIITMAAGIATVPLAELAGQDGTPRSWFMKRANRAFDQAEARTRQSPVTSRTRRTRPAIGLVAEAVLAGAPRSARRSRAGIAPARHQT